MSKNWDYSELAHNAKLNGGPEKYLELIKEHSHRIGKLEGKSEGKAEVLIAEGIAIGFAALAFAGYKAYEIISDKKEREAIKKQDKTVAVAEKELVKSIQKAIEVDNEGEPITSCKEEKTN